MHTGSTFHGLLKLSPEITTRGTETIVQYQIVRHSAIILGSVAERFDEVVSVKSHIDNFLENLLVNLFLPVAQYLEEEQLNTSEDELGTKGVAGSQGWLLVSWGQLQASGGSNL